MGREIRKVPPNWDHPKSMRSYGREGFQPMYDERFEDAAAKWKADYAAWEAGEKLKHPNGDGSLMEFWEWDGGPPDREYYRPWTDAEATWLQVWETVSEGTPVSPPFATPEELIDYLAEHGDFWDQKRGDGPWKRANAERFVKSGWAPSLIVMTSESGGVVAAPRDGFPA